MFTAALADDLSSDTNLLYSTRSNNCTHIAVGLMLAVSCRLALVTATLHESLLSRVCPFFFAKPSTTGIMNSGTLMYYKRGCFHVPKSKVEHFNDILPSSREGEICDQGSFPKPYPRRDLATVGGAS